LNGWIASPAGNIRELRNLIERATLLADGETIELQHLTEMADDLPALPSSVEGDFQLNEVIALDSLETSYLAWAKKRLGGDLPALAQQLGVSQRTLYRKLQSC
jgi:DNA-binding NtrC family response regulator